ncbi:MAG TPA: polysaccharide pyruvyl transferase family protein [Planctomycetota bacterium]|jgi:polysaccharide pyruvyl transferase WcaK-like protein|nr:polysaccharide pyruvyl transferase family protein [Planctomycetota bacterium]
MTLSRRAFFAASATLAAGCAVPYADPRRVRILLRSSWQTVNIGDIAHTPGMLRLLEEELPNAEVTLWPNPLSREVEAMLRRRFPKLRIAATPEDQKQALSENDFFLHGSGPGLVGHEAMKAWRATGKPYGIGGVTINEWELKGANYRELLAGARFVFCRDTQSLEALRAAGLGVPVQEFGPDATFVVDLRDDRRAEAFLREHGLDSGGFACFVPRLRWTPYWKEGRKMPPEQVREREAENARHVDADHAKMRQAIVAWVGETGQKALLCPEMTYEVELLRPLLYDPLPAEVKSKVVVKPSYWLTDEAVSTYRHAAAVVSLEMHSPILAIAGGRPAIHLRQPTDTRKGQMWRDVGLGDWLFEIDAATGDQIAERLLSLHRDPEATRAAAARARTFADGKCRAMMRALSSQI